MKSITSSMWLALQHTVAALLLVRLLERVDACLGPDLDPRGPSNIVWRLGTPRASDALMWDASRAAGCLLRSLP